MKMKKMMMLSALVGVCVLGSTMARGQGGSDELFSVNNIFSRTKIVAIDGSVYRLDTSSGELFRFKGTLSGPQANGIFNQIVDPLTGPNSGFLQIQKGEEGLFLVDVVTGATWLLRQKSPTIGSWMPIGTQ